MMYVSFGVKVMAGGKGVYHTSVCESNRCIHDGAYDPTEFSLPRFRKKERQERIKTYTVGRHATSIQRVKLVQP